MVFPPGYEGTLSPGSDLRMELYRPISRPDDPDTSFAALLQDALADVSVRLDDDIPCLPAEEPRFTVVSTVEMERAYNSFNAMYHEGVKEFDDHLFQWIQSEPREAVDGMPQSINIRQAKNGWWNVELGFSSESCDAIRKKIYNKLTVRKNPNAKFIEPQSYSVVMASIQVEDNPMQIQEAMLTRISSRVSPIALGAFGIDISLLPPRRLDSMR